MKWDLFTSRPKVNDVFTPRRTDINSDIYIVRPELERELKRSIEGSLHTIIYGESGSGKSWLYKKVLNDLGAYVSTANCANAVRFGTLTKEIENLVGYVQPEKRTERTSEASAGIKAFVAEGGIKGSDTFTASEVDPLLDCFRLIRQQAGGRLAVLVIDNLEMIFESIEVMKEVASIITLLDDSRYAQYKVKLLIVGVPSHVKDYFLGIQESVANRLSEMSEISSLSKEQVGQLVKKGFVDLLRIEIANEELSVCQEHVFKVTMGFAQHVQEYCEQLGYVLEDSNWSFSNILLQKADEQWLKKGLSQASVTIASLMNERDTKLGRRNQVLYVLGKVERRVFHINDVEQLLRAEFPDSTTDVSLAVGQMLADLASRENAIIKRSAKGPTYEFRDARMAMAARVMLQKIDGKDKVEAINPV